MNGPQSHRATEINALTSRIIGCAIEVHRALGPGLLESIYETAITIEFDELGMCYQRQLPIPAYYKGRMLGHYRIDLLVEDIVLVEVKAVTHMNAIFEAQLLTYLRLTNTRCGLLINFNARLLKDGVQRFVL
jgi:GxxExxY protein